MTFKRVFEVDPGGALWSESDAHRDGRDGRDQRQHQIAAPSRLGHNKLRSLVEAQRMAVTKTEFITSKNAA